MHRDLEGPSHGAPTWGGRNRRKGMRAPTQAPPQACGATVETHCGARTITYPKRRKDMQMAAQTHISTREMRIFE